MGCHRSVGISCVANRRAEQASLTTMPAGALVWEVSSVVAVIVSGFGVRMKVTSVIDILERTVLCFSV